MQTQQGGLHDIFGSQRGVSIEMDPKMDDQKNCFIWSQSQKNAPSASYPIHSDCLVGDDKIGPDGGSNGQNMMVIGKSQQQPSQGSEVRDTITWY